MVILLLGVPAMSAETDDVSAVEQKATTAFALGHYTDAAQSFEKAFELKPDPALLYNAAQAHRLAGNKERALVLYENYVRVYGKREKREDVETRIAELKQAIAHDKAVSVSPPTGTEPVGAAAAAPPAMGAVAAPPTALRSSPVPQSASSPPMLLSQPTPAESDQVSMTRKPWFWAAIGGGVLAAVVVGIVLASGSKDPSASLGKANGN